MRAWTVTFALGVAISGVVACSGTSKGNGNGTSGNSTSGSVTTTSGGTSGSTPPPSGSGTLGGGGKGVFGGLNGSSSGGTSGTSGSTSACGFNASDTSCTSCVKDYCCDEYETCSRNSSCVALANCYGACSTTQCYSTCDSTFGAGKSDISSLITCGQGFCSSSCR